MKLSVSNIGWREERDREVLAWMREYGYSGLEIAPTRIFPEDPYNKLTEAKRWAEKIKDDYGFTIPSMQSIWFGRKENIFGAEEERRVLIAYTQKAIDFAERIGCKNLVFGCPRNRNLPVGVDAGTAVVFFRELGDYAAAHHTVIGMEANPPMYNTNYINDTASAFRLIEGVDSKGFQLNLDLGTVIHNGEHIRELEGRISLINHVHISEPGLKPIKKRWLHQELKAILEAENYQGFVSIEMGAADNIENIKSAVQYIREVFGE